MARDHLFISYAWANAAFVDWLAMRLTADGYKVWVDRHKLQGGQNWVNEIDNAIKTQSCRLLGVVSGASLSRPAPQGEWQLAMGLSRQYPNFFMPLLLEQMDSTNLPFNLQVTQYTPFHDGWATGLRQLLKYLSEQGVPKDQQAGFREVGYWRDARTPTRPKQERLWSNELALKVFPSQIHLYEVPRQSLPLGWVMQPFGENGYWAFREPPECRDFKHVRTIDWQQEPPTDSLKPPNVFKALVHNHLEKHCLARGLKRSPDQKYMYVPLGLLAGNKIRFVTYNGAQTWGQLAGTTGGENNRRKTRLLQETPRRPRPITNYHLAPVLKVHTSRWHPPVLVMNLRVFLTDEQGNALPGKQMTPRRKRVCKQWFNHKWLSLQLAMRELLFGVGALQSSSLQNLRVGEFAQYRAAVGLDDSKFKARAEDEDVIDTEEADEEE